MNAKRVRRGLRPRPVRAVVIGFPNVGKSALINRLLGRRVADSAPKPGVTRVLKWMRIGGELDLLDAPGGWGWRVGNGVGWSLWEEGRGGEVLRVGVGGTGCEA